MDTIRGSACFDVRKYEKKQSLLIIDSGASRWFDAFVKQTIEYAKTTGKDGVTVISDMDSFSYSQKGDLLQYEMTLPKVFEGMDLKGRCAYHMRGFGRLALESLWCPLSLGWVSYTIFKRVCFCESLTFTTFQH